MPELLAGIREDLRKQDERERAEPARRELVDSVSTIPDDMVRDACDAIGQIRVGTVPLAVFVQARLDDAKTKVGRPVTIPVAALLVAMLLCAVDSREVSCAQASRLLYRRISDQARGMLGLLPERAPLPPPGRGLPGRPGGVCVRGGRNGRSSGCGRCSIRRRTRPGGR